LAVLKGAAVAALAVVVLVVIVIAHGSIGFEQ
jgi:hypothetical protein